jgi:DNA-directed RNA polymerase specialized sigma24 family protein
MSETAALLKLPLGTVKTHSHRALAKLKQILSAWEREPAKERLST